MKTKERPMKTYRVTHRRTRDCALADATNAQDACKQLGWQIGDCHVELLTPRDQAPPGA